ncbi:MAG: hypothetical protein V4665_03055 [Patescibacteria group bacterium]
MNMLLSLGIWALCMPAPGDTIPLSALGEWSFALKGEGGQSYSRTSWEKFYSYCFSLTEDFSSVVIPARPSGNWRLLIVGKGLTLKKATRALSDIFQVKNVIDGDLDTVVYDIRAIPRPYALWVLDSPDPEYMGWPAASVDSARLTGMTLCERLLYEAVFYKETGVHPDLQTVTLCSGSRHSLGYVPCVRFWGNVHNSSGMFLDEKAGMIHLPVLMSGAGKVIISLDKPANSWAICGIREVVWQ